VRHTAGIVGFVLSDFQIFAEIESGPAISINTFLKLRATSLNHRFSNSCTWEGCRQPRAGAMAATAMLAAGLSATNEVGSQASRKAAKVKA
jgi:hypothetical protein